MWDAKSITHMGKTYHSHGAAAQALGVSYTTIKRHLKTFGHLKNVQAPKSTEITVNGYTFKSIKAASRAIDIPPSTLAKYLTPEASDRQKQELKLKVENYRLKQKLATAPKRPKKYKFDASGKVSGIGIRTHRMTAPTADLAMDKFRQTYPMTDISNLQATPVARAAQ
ncbi:MAG: NUMOD1 domain-containing DNA-binding protein [Litorimonas sp.]